MRDPQPHRNDGEQRDDGDEGVRPLPAQMLPEPRRDGHADDVRHRQASEHHRHGPGAPVLLDEGGRDDGADAEERAVRHARDEAREQQHRVARGDRRADVADEERDHESEQDVLARHLREQHRDERRTDDHAERVRRHRVACARDRDADARAICGSSPIVTNSVVPMAKPPSASARIARPARGSLPWRFERSASTASSSQMSCSAVASVTDPFFRTRTPTPSR